MRRSGAAVERGYCAGVMLSTDPAEPATGNRAGGREGAVATAVVLDVLGRENGLTGFLESTRSVALLCNGQDARYAAAKGVEPAVLAAVAFGGRAMVVKSKGVGGRVLDAPIRP